MASSDGKPGGVFEHHVQTAVCDTRAKYREGRRPRAVKVYTINLESQYLLIQGVPAVGAMKELVERFALYGAIEQYNALDEYPAEDFTEVYLIKFVKLQSARGGRLLMVWKACSLEPRVSTNPEPRVSTNPEPRVSTNPEPRVSTNPEPRVSTNPEPRVSTNPEPRVSTNPEPRVSTNPEPRVSTNPEPRVSTNPEPRVSTNPEPRVSTNPEPRVSTNPEPRVSTNPEPRVSTNPEPRVSTNPEPRVSTNPEPRVSTNPEPRVSTNPEPRVSTNPEPRVSTNPEPRVSTNPEPRVSTNPEPRVSTNPEPRVSTNPEPRVSTNPEPRVSTNPEPRVSTNPEPRVSTNPEPRVSTNPEPRVSTNPEPRVSTNPEPRVSTNPEPRVSTNPEPRVSTNPDTIDSGVKTSEWNPSFRDEWPCRAEGETELRSPVLVTSPKLHILFSSSVTQPNQDPEDPELVQEGLVVAKKRMDEQSFFGGLLHVCYAPEFETVEETRKKLEERKAYIARVTKNQETDFEDFYMTKKKPVPEQQGTKDSRQDFHPRASGFGTAALDTCPEGPLETASPCLPYSCQVPLSYFASKSTCSPGERPDRASHSCNSARSHGEPPKHQHHSAFPPKPQMNSYKSSAPCSGVQEAISASQAVGRFMPRTTQLQERKRRRDCDGELGTNTSSNGVLIGPKLPGIPTVDLQDDSLNTTANLIRNKLKEVISSVPMPPADSIKDVCISHPQKQRRRI
ncbi:RNA-binding protein 48 [Apodemus speciosus]|uniref:RNA-binding protein 48 n=1 Tax=Apodemus speciosus TaxID=105296 RepID=A0ABQ0ER28_APOSI